MSSQKELYAESGILSSYDGSARLSLGSSLAYASVTGPGYVRAALGGKERLFDQSTVEVSSRSRNGERLLGSAWNSLGSALMTSEYPRLHTALHLQMGEDNGSYPSTAINAGSLALMDSGLALQFLPAAINLALTPQGTFILDPNEQNSTEAIALFLFVFESKSLQLLSGSIIKGKVSIKTFNKALKMAREASKSVFEFYRTAAQKKFSKD